MEQPPETDLAGARRDPPCVVYLLWGPLGLEPVRAFLRSYRAHAAGLEHRLVIVLNGVQERGARAAFEAELEGVEHELIVLPAPVLDLLAYRQAAERLCAGRYCFLNSYSRVLGEDWLAHMDRALADPGVGIVAASASWASMLSYALFQLGLPSAYRDVFDGRRATLREFERLHTERTGETPSENAVKRRLGAVLSLAPMLVGFTPFPAYHVRTNAFAIEHRTCMKLFTAHTRRKVQTHRLESGRHSYTAQLERDGMRALVVDRDGRRYGREEWAASETFWQGEQRGLLIADNQTDYYAEGDARRRLLLARYAWGAQARPS